MSWYRCFTVAGATSGRFQIVAELYDYRERCPFTQIVVAAYCGRCGIGVVWMAVASYYLLPLSVILRDPAGRWGGVILFRIVGEGAFLSLILAYAAAYRLTVEVGRRGEVSPRFQAETATAAT
jgi:hypothetical protein